MNLLSSYIFKQVWGVTLALTLGLAMLVLLTQSLRFLDLMISAGASPGVFFQLMGLSLPRLVEIVLPIALAVGVLIVGLKLLGDQELTVMQATGTSPWQLTRPVLAAGTLAATLLAVLAFWATPASIATLAAQRQMIKAQFSLSLLQPGVFNFFGEDIMVYFDSRDDEGRLVNMILHDQRDKLRPYTLLAESGELISDGTIYRLHITNGRRQQLNQARGIVDQLAFTQYEIELPKTIREVNKRWKEPNERTLPELLKPVIDPVDINNADDLRVELHRRLASPFLPFSFALPVLWLILTFARPRQGTFKLVGAAILMIGLIEGLTLGMQSWAEKSVLGIAGIYIVSILPALLCLIRFCPPLFYRLKVAA